MNEFAKEIPRHALRPAILVCGIKTCFALHRTSELRAHSLLVLKLSSVPLTIARNGVCLRTIGYPTVISAVRVLE